MKHGLVLMMAGAAALSLAACSGGGTDNAQNASTEDVSEPADGNMAMSDPANPFTDAEAKMSQAMMSANGSDVGDNWAKKMIAHHQGAVDMSEVVLQQNPKADVAKMARDAIEKQKKDIADIEKLMKSGAPDQRSAELYRPAMMDMQQKMQAATGADPSETYMRKMVEHHKGAVAMSDVALKNGVSGAMREQVQKTRSDNAKDAEMTEAMLSGKPMQQAMEESGAKSAAEAKKEPAPAEKAKTPPKASSKASSDPMAGHDMSNMSDMNHM